MLADGSQSNEQQYNYTGQNIMALQQLMHRNKYLTYWMCSSILLLLWSEMLLPQFCSDGSRHSCSIFQTWWTHSSELS